MFHEAALCGLRQELHERQMVVRIDGIPEIRCSDEPSFSYALHLPCETIQPRISWQVLEDSVGVNDVESLVGKGQCASVEDNSLHAGEAVTIILHIREREATSNDL